MTMAIKGFSIDCYPKKKKKLWTVTDVFGKIEELNIPHNTVFLSRWETASHPWEKFLKFSVHSSNLFQGFTQNLLSNISNASAERKTPYTPSWTEQGNMSLPSLTEFESTKNNRLLSRHDSSQHTEEEQSSEFFACYLSPMRAVVMSLANGSFSRAQAQRV